MCRHLAIRRSSCRSPARILARTKFFQYGGQQRFIDMKAGAAKAFDGLLEVQESVRVGRQEDVEGADGGDASLLCGQRTSPLVNENGRQSQFQGQRNRLRFPRVQFHAWQKD